MRRLAMTAAIVLMVAVMGACGGGGAASADAAPTDAPFDASSSSNSALAALVPSVGVLVPPFEPEILEYDLDLLLADEEVSFTASAAVPAGSAIDVAGVAVSSGQPSPAIALDPGDQLVDILVTASDGSASTYRVHVRRGSDEIVAVALSQRGGVLENPLSFESATSTYAGDVGLWVEQLEVTIVTLDPDATVIVGGGPAAPGVPSLPIPLNLGLTAIAVTVSIGDGTQRSYTVAVTRAAQAAQQAYVKASNPDAYDIFGAAIAISGDTLVVAADEASATTGVNGNQADNSAAHSGAVYVFTRNGSSWSQQAYLKPSNTGAGDGFGLSVALSGDTLAVGAAFEGSAATGVNGNQADNSMPYSGAVYVFVRTGSTWSQQAYVKASNTAAWDGFGWSVALWGDTLAVGAVVEASAATGIGGDQSSDGAAGSGAVYVFTRSNATWSQQAYIKASNTGADDLFGSAVALWGDTLAVSAAQEDSAATGVNGDQASNGAADSGAAYVFVRAGSTWSQQAYLKAANTAASDHFGGRPTSDGPATSLALWGDTVAVGAQHQDNATEFPTSSSPDSGAVYVFKRNGIAWSQQAYLTQSDLGMSDSFGQSVALWGDALAVGANREDSAASGVDGNQADNSATVSGAVYVFAFSGSWQQRSYVKASNTGSGDQFGIAVGLWAGTLAVGAGFESSSATGIDGNGADNSAGAAGAAYVFR